MATSTSTTSSNGSHAKEAIDREVETLKDDISKLTQQVASLVSTTGNAAYRRARKISTACSRTRAVKARKRWMR